MSDVNVALEKSRSPCFLSIAQTIFFNNVFDCRANGPITAAFYDAAMLARFCVLTFF